MKKLLSLVLILLICCCASPLNALAEGDTVVSGDWKYQVIYRYNGIRYGEITGYTGEITDTLVIPSRLDNVRIVGVKRFMSNVKMPENIIVSAGIRYLNNCFSGKNNSFRVQLPSTLEAMEKSFSHCTVKSINLPEGLKCIGFGSFECVTFENPDIRLPESLLYLSNYAFYETNIRSVFIGSKTKIGGYSYLFPVGYTVEAADGGSSPFAKCYDLDRITLSRYNMNLKMKDGVLYDKFYTTAYASDNTVKKVTLPDTVRSICSSAFRGRKMQRLVLGAGLSKIGYGAFWEAEAEEIVFKSGNTCELIDKYAFLNAKAGRFTLPRSVTHIGEAAFKGFDCKAFSIENGSCLTEIEKGAFVSSTMETLDFSPCRALTTLHNYALSSYDAPNESLKRLDVRNTNLSNLPWEALKNCTALKELYVSVNTSTISAQYQLYISDFDGNFVQDEKPVAKETEEYQFREYENCIEIYRYTGDEKEVSVPAYIDGKPVRNLCYGTFKNTGITSLTLPDTLRKISDYAIQELQLTSIDFGNGVEYIGDGYCAAAQISFPDSVKYFGNLLPENIKSVHLGKSVISVDHLWNPIRSHKYSQLEEITVSSENQAYSADHGVLYTKDKKTLLKYPDGKTDGAYVIPDGTEIIGKNAFENNRYLKKLTVPTSVFEIDSTAFTGEYPSISGVEKTSVAVQSLEEVAFGDNRIENLSDAFYQIATLKKVTFGSNAYVRHMSSTFAGTAIEEMELPDCESVLGIFRNVKTLKRLTFKEGIEFIGANAFQGTSIETLVLPDSAVYIGRCAFGYCDQLTTVDLKNVVMLAGYSFTNCEKLERLDLTGVRYNSTDFENCPNLKIYSYTRRNAGMIPAEANMNNDTLEAVVIGGGIEEIGSSAFADCSNLETAMIAESVTEIDDSAFENCENLTIVCVENSVAHLYALKKNISVVTLKIAAVPDQQYTGRAVTPALTVTLGDTLLKKDADYTAVYENNVQPGTARAIVAGKGDYSIYGATVKFNIIKAEEQAQPSQPSGEATQAKQGKTPPAITPTVLPTTAATKTILSRPVLKKPKRRKNTVKLSWRRVSGAGGYQLQYSTDKRFKKAKTVSLSAGKTSVTLRKLKKGKTYYFRIRAVKGKTTSSWSKKRAVKVSLP